VKRFRELCEELRRTSSKNKKVEILRRYLEEMSMEERRALIYLLLSKIDGYTLSIIKEAIGDFTPYYRGDTYEAVFKYLSNKRYRQTTLLPKNLSIQEVIEALISAGRENRANVLRGIISILDNETASLLISTLLNDLQVGVGEGLVLEALAKIYKVEYEDLKKRLCVAGWENLLEGREEILRPGIKFRPMLAEKAMSLEEIIRENNFWIEPKLDGVRILLHKDGDKIKIFSRRGKDITGQFPEILEYAKDIRERVILDGEVIALKNGRILPFQNIMRRFGERKNVEIDFYFFDAVYIDRAITELPYLKRVSMMEDVTDKTIPRWKIIDVESLQKEFERLISEGYEGIVCKKETGRYIIGKRTKDWLKYKRNFEVDAVITAAEWGHGRRRKWLSDYHLALWQGDRLVEVGKTFKGLRHIEMERLTKILLENKAGDIPGGILVKPRIVVEVEFEDVQISPKYEKYTLRFARIKRIRDDKTPDEAGKIEEIEKIYKMLHPV